jgi:CRISPR/Cas system-associated exonuclease Cas4 (RecB family)
LSFGMPLDVDHDASSVREPVPLDARFLLRGSIDLVEVQPSTGAMRVTDYKTGKNRTTPYQVVGGGGALQPVIYGMVVEHLFQRPVGHARLDFATTPGGFTEHVVSLRDEAKRAGIEVLEIIDRAIESGRLPAAPKDYACRYCDFFAVCGPLEEQRFKQKTKDREIVGDLLELRGMK